MIAQNWVRFIFAVSIVLASLVYLVVAWNLVSVCVHLSIISIFLWGTLAPNSRLFGPIITTTGSESLWLTIDDGPDPKDTPLLLDLLDEYEAKATFFVIGEKAEQYPDLIKQIHERGHELGNHTYTHPQFSFWRAGPWLTQKEIEQCQKAISPKPICFRAPVGHANFFVSPVVRTLGMKLIGWTSRGYDTASNSSQKSIGHLLKTMKPGAIVLIHEATPIAKEVTRSVLQYAQKNKWSWINPNHESPQSKSC